MVTGPAGQGSSPSPKLWRWVPVTHRDRSDLNQPSVSPQIATRPAKAKKWQDSPPPVCGGGNSKARSTAVRRFHQLQEYGAQPDQGALALPATLLQRLRRVSGVSAHPIWQGR